MNWSLKIPSHRKCVTTLPCETLMFKNWSKSTLINISCRLSCHNVINWIILSSGIWSSLVISAAISHYHFWYILLVVIFSESCVCHDIMCIIRCSQSKSNVRDLYELRDFCPLNSPDLSTFIYTEANMGQRVYKKKPWMWMIWGRIWLMRELEWNRVLLTLSFLIHGAHVSMPAFEPQEDIFNIHRDTN